MRFSDMAKTAAIGLAVGGSAYAPLALIDTQTAGAVPEKVQVVLTTDPEYYVHTDDALCLQVYNRTYVCVYELPGGGASQP